MGKKNSKKTYAGIDIGGTKIYAVVTDADGKVLASAKKKSRAEKGFKAVIERAATCLADACENAGIAVDDLSTVGVGAPSPILPDGTAVSAVNMGWSNVPLVKAMEKATGKPVAAQNDCNLGTLGEYALGGGKGASSLVGFFMGTGLGAGIVYKGKLVVGENSQGVEIGHTIVVEDGRICGCGHNGCLEAYASKTGMGRRFTWEILHQGRKSVLSEVCEDGDYSNVRSGMLASAYRDGDELVVEVLHEAAHYLGVGVANMITILAPDVVVVGGGVFEAMGKELLPVVKKSAKGRIWPEESFKDTKIVLASLGDDAVALGAMVYAKETL